MFLIGYETVVKNMSGFASFTWSIVASMSSIVLAVVPPHQEHPDLDAVLLRHLRGALHLLDLDAALHGVEDPLAAALDPIQMR